MGRYSEILPSNQSGGRGAPPYFGQCSTLCLGPFCHFNNNELFHVLMIVTHSMLHCSGDISFFFFPSHSHFSISDLGYVLQSLIRGSQVTFSFSFPMFAWNKNASYKRGCLRLAVLSGCDEDSGGVLWVVRRAFHGFGEENEAVYLESRAAWVRTNPVYIWGRLQWEGPARVRLQSCVGGSAERPQDQGELWEGWAPLSQAGARSGRVQRGAKTVKEPSV